MKTHTIRSATPSDYGMFISLWEEFLKTRELDGSIVPCSEAALRFATDLFFRVTCGSIAGVCLISPSKGCNLWAPELPFPTKLGRTLIAQGTFVKPDFRITGLGMGLFDRGIELAREQGFEAVLSSVDVGNALSERNASVAGFSDVQVSKIVSTAVRE